MNFTNYYNTKSQEFIDRTFNIDMSSLMKDFLAELPEGATVLDIGCGSGRDSKIFDELGYDVYAVDASEKMVEHTQQFIGDRVVLSTFQDYKTDMTFDGLWASASLLHVPEEEMVSVVRKFRSMLKTGGVFHMSFKCRDTHFVQGERSFTCYREDSLRAMVQEVGGFEELRLYETNSAKDSSTGERWINVLLRKN